MWFFRQYKALFGIAGQWGRCNFNETIEKFPNAKVIHGTSKKYRGKYPGKIILLEERRVNGLDNLELLAEYPGILLSDVLFEQGAVYIGDFNFVL
jgi:hypothetical protein